MRFSKFLAAPLLALLVLTGCDPDDDNPTNPVADTTTVYVINEGNITRSNGTVSLFNKETKALTLDLFQNANGR